MSVSRAWSSATACKPRGISAESVQKCFQWIGKLLRSCEGNVNKVTYDSCILMRRSTHHTQQILLTKSDTTSGCIYEQALHAPFHWRNSILIIRILAMCWKLRESGNERMGIAFPACDTFHRCVTAYISNTNTVPYLFVPPIWISAGQWIQQLTSVTSNLKVELAGENY